MRRKRGDFSVAFKYVYRAAGSLRACIRAARLALALGLARFEKKSLRTSQTPANAQDALTYGDGTIADN
jgi:hypothetical protein